MTLFQLVLSVILVMAVVFAYREWSNHNTTTFIYKGLKRMNDSINKHYKKKGCITEKDIEKICWDLQKRGLNHGYYLVPYYVKVGETFQIYPTSSKVLHFSGLFNPPSKETKVDLIGYKL